MHLPLMKMFQRNFVFLWTALSITYRLRSSALLKNEPSGCTLHIRANSHIVEVIETEKNHNYMYFYTECGFFLSLKNSIQFTISLWSYFVFAFILYFHSCAYIVFVCCFSLRSFNLIQET